MRTKEDNLLKIAAKYEEEFSSDYENLDEKELNKIFSSVIKDYGRIFKRCSTEGVDAGESEANDYKKDFKISTAEEKEELINRVEERIASLIEICEEVPNDIDEKYAREKDLVTLFKL